MNIVQIKYKGKNTVVAVVDGDDLRIVSGHYTTYELAQKAILQELRMEEMINYSGFSDTVSYDAYLNKGWVSIPLHHPDPAHFYICGTGLTHLGSADARHQMHSNHRENSEPQQSDSIRMFHWGLEGGKPIGEDIGVQPEWFYKGNGTIALAVNEPLIRPNFAKDGSEEPEICGMYINGENGDVYRIGFVIGNEYSDHTIERENYLYLAHSKLRQCSFSPELVLGELPKHIEGVSAIIRDGQKIWQKEFVSGEDNMSHSIANLEHHHFKYALFRQAGDLHAHFFGTATLSYADDINIQDGDIMHIESTLFGKPLSNPVKYDDSTPQLTPINVL